MNNEYIGKNSKTEYARIKNKGYVCYLIYLFIACILLSLAIYYLINNIIGFKVTNRFDGFELFFYWFLLITILITLGWSITGIVVFSTSIKKNINLIKYYNTTKLTNVKEIMINYDYKLWLTAPKDTFHPQNFNLVINEEKRLFKTAIIFTNSSKYNTFPKFNMPPVLMAKNYINNYALVGYDEKNDEGIIIDFRVRREE